MKRISKRVSFVKNVFPLLWAGIWTSGAVSAFRSARPAVGVLLLLAAAIGGYFLFRRQMKNLMDEIFDDGDALVVRDAGKEERIPFSEIMNVNAVQGFISLRLGHPRRFGDEIAFSLKQQRWFISNPFARDPLVESLIVRVDQARSMQRN